MYARILRTVLGLAALLAAPGQAQACLVPQPLEISDIAGAALVVRGRIADYEVFDRRVEHLDAYYARIRVEVTATWRGEERAAWDLHWTNGTMRLPESWPHGDEAVIAAVAAPPALARFLTGGDGAATDGADRMLVLQRDCARPFVFSTRPSADEVAAWRRESEGLRRMMDLAPNERMRRRLDRMLGAHPEKVYGRRIAALRACLDEDAETCKAVWPGQ